MPSILLIEDDIDVRLVFIEILHDAGFEVDAAASFGIGEAILAGRDYDLLICDARLPDGTGTALADQARGRGIPAIIVTGDAFDKGLDPSKYTVLGKPMQTHTLLAVIQRLLDGG